MKRVWGICLTASLLTLTAATGWADDSKPSADQKSKESYVLGYEFGGNLKKQNVEVDLDVLVAAIKDGMAGSKPTLSPEEAKRVVQQLRKRLLVVQNALNEQTRTKNREAGEAFLAANKAKEGVVTLASGLQYKVLKEGKGPKPQAGDRVSVNYRGTLIDGNEFDSSYSRGEPTTIALNGVIKGWSEALPLMNTGSKWEIYVPADLAYGERKFGSIPPNSTLVFELELLGIVNGAASAAAAPAHEGHVD